jgi:hypothetical protein
MVDAIRPDLEPVKRAPRLKRGQRFGLLTVVECMGAHRLGHEYLMKCDCGREAFRTAAQLTASVKRGFEPCCHQCAAELRRGRRIDQCAQRRFGFTELFERTGSLYGLDWEAREVAAIRRESDLTAPPMEARTYQVDVPASAPGPADSAAMTLEEIGEDFGLNRERIRQIERHAMLKLRHPSRARYLKEFVRPDAPINRGKIGIDGFATEAELNASVARWRQARAAERAQANAKAEVSKAWGGWFDGPKRELKPSIPKPREVPTWLLLQRHSILKSAQSMRPIRRLQLAHQRNLEAFRAEQWELNARYVSEEYELMKRARIEREARKRQTFKRICERQTFERFWEDAAERHRRNTEG